MTKKRVINEEIMRKLEQIEKRIDEQHFIILKRTEMRLRNATLTASGFFGIAVALAAAVPYSINKDPIFGFIGVVGLLYAIGSATILMVRGEKILRERKIKK
jgi:formate/nitrite transporter FocA (FNT family)